jgi:hypothetical protein
MKRSGSMLLWVAGLLILASGGLGPVVAARPLAAASQPPLQQQQQQQLEQQPHADATSVLFDDLRGAPIGTTAAGAAVPSAVAAAPSPTTAPAQLAAGPCRLLSVVNAFTVVVDPATGASALNGTVAIANRDRYVAAASRVGVRVCSKTLDHIRVEATCPDADGDRDSEDVRPGATLVCTWRAVLPAPPKAGSTLAEWSGVKSSITLALSGDRCMSDVNDPSSGLPNGTC